MGGGAPLAPLKRYATQRTTPTRRARGVTDRTVRYSTRTSYSHCGALVRTFGSLDGTGSYCTVTPHVNARVERRLQLDTSARFTGVDGVTPDAGGSGAVSA